MVDGGVLERVPVRAVREMGAEIVIAVDVGVYEEEYKISNMFDVVFASVEIMAKEITGVRGLEADVQISPNLKEIAPFQFQLAEKAIAEGEQAAYRTLPLIRSVLHQKTQGEGIGNG